MIGEILGALLLAILLWWFFGISFQLSLGVMLVGALVLYLAKRD